MGKILQPQLSSQEEVVTGIFRDLDQFTIKLRPSRIRLGACNHHDTATTHGLVNKKNQRVPRQKIELFGKYGDHWEPFSPNPHPGADHLMVILRSRSPGPIINYQGT